MKTIMHYFINTIQAKPILLLMSILFSSCQPNPESISAISSEEFSFEYNGLKYSGLIEHPTKKPSSLIIIIPGHGKTNIVSGNQEGDVRNFFTQQGLVTVAWDRAGCGKSEGEYNHQQTVQSSAEEALAAIAKIRKRNIVGSEKIGIWGFSRGGWIAPLIIKDDPLIAFWISVSGTDNFESFPYLLESNFRLKGRNEAEVNILMQEWDFGWKAIRGNISYQDFLDGTRNIADEPFAKKMNIKTPSEDNYLELQRYYKNRSEKFDEETGLEIVIQNFDEMLNTFKIPVLAVFGELDSQVNWRRTKALYEKTMGENPKGKLLIKTIPDCNHIMMKSETGALFENLSQFNYQSCDGYFDTMEVWLKKWVL